MSDSSDTSVIDDTPVDEERAEKDARSRGLEVTQKADDGKRKMSPVGNNRRTKKSCLKTSDTSDTSICDSADETGPLRKVESPKDEVPGRKGVSIKRSQLLAALSILEKDISNPPEPDPAQERLTDYQRLLLKRSCSLDLTTRHRRDTKMSLLRYSLSNAIFRHDWSTAARCAQLMVPIESCSQSIYRTLLLILLNHPNSNSDIVTNFMSQVLQLRTKPEQLRFLRQSFLLADNIDVYSHHEHHPMRSEMQAGSSSEDDE